MNETVALRSHPILWAKIIFCCCRYSHARRQRGKSRASLNHFYPSHLYDNFVRDFHQLYRDCLRLIRHVAPGHANRKGLALRRTVRNEFEKHRNEANPDTIENAKLNAVRALSNYMLANSAPKDPKLQQPIKDFHTRSVDMAKNFPPKE